MEISPGILDGYRDSRAGWAGQPAQDKEAVDDDLQDEEEKNNSGFLSEILVTHFSTIYIIIRGGLIQWGRSNRPMD